jgi:hypothetical protein
MLLGGELRKMVILMLLLRAVCVHAGRTVNVSK